MNTIASSTTKHLFLNAPALASACVTGTYVSNGTNANGGRSSHCEAMSSSSSSLSFNGHRTRTVELRKRMTSIGRFSYKSETIQNPSIPTFFLALSENNKNNDVLNVNEMNEIWKQKKIMDKHSRFRSVISSHDDRYFVDRQTQFRDHANPTFHSSLLYRTDLKKRIEYFLTDEMDLREKLWEVQMSSGKLGSSGAISKAKTEAILKEANERNSLETVMLFRSHHAMADGVSIASVIGEISDEADEVQAMIRRIVHVYKTNEEKKDAQQSMFSRFMKMIQLMLNIFKTLIQHGVLVMTSSNPFARVLATDAESGRRSISWCEICTIEEAKSIAKIIFPGATLNDLFVSCVSTAIAKQLEEHHKHTSLQRYEDIMDMVLPSYFNIVVPVHLSGGILLPGESLGNRIGAFVSALPTKYLSSDTSQYSSQNLEAVSKSLGQLKSSPAACISWAIAKTASEYLPDAITKFLMRSANANAVCVVSNVRVPVSDKLHLNGRPIESICGFLPLPPGVPIGVVVQSYAGEISLTVTADTRAVPDADRFMYWLLEEYEKLRNLSNLMAHNQEDS